MTSIDETLSQYFKAWNSHTEDDCARFVHASCSPDILYFDPRYTCRGRGELITRIHTGRKDFPGSRVAVTSAIDGYDDTFRYAWTFVIDAPPMTLRGLDVIVRAKDGTMTSVTSFFGDLEALAAGEALRVQPRFGVPVGS